MARHRCPAMVEVSAVLRLSSWSLDNPADRGGLRVTLGVSDASTERKGDMPTRTVRLVTTIGTMRWIQTSDPSRSSR